MMAKLKTGKLLANAPPTLMCVGATSVAMCNHVFVGM